MNLKISMCGMLATALVFGVGCKKKEETTGATTSAAAPAPAAPAAPTGSAVAAPGDVASYPNMTPASGTVRMLQPFTVHQAADAASPVLSTLGIGTNVDLKGQFSNWMLIQWPSGVGQLSPGWIELRSVNDPRVAQTQKEPGLVPASAPTGHIQIRLPPKKH